MVRLSPHRLMLALLLAVLVSAASVAVNVRAEDSGWPAPTTASLPGVTQAPAGNRFT